jgi:hypothetical protein
LRHSISFFRRTFGLQTWSSTFRSLWQLRDRLGTTRASLLIPQPQSALFCRVCYLKTASSWHSISIVTFLSLDTMLLLNISRASLLVVELGSLLLMIVCGWCFRLAIFPILLNAAALLGAIIIVISHNAHNFFYFGFITDVGVIVLGALAKWHQERGTASFSQFIAPNIVFIIAIILGSICVLFRIIASVAIFKNPSILYENSIFTDEIPESFESDTLSSNDLSIPNQGPKTDESFSTLDVESFEMEQRSAPLHMGCRVVSMLLASFFLASIIYFGLFNFLLTVDDSNISASPYIRVSLSGRQYNAGLGYLIAITGMFGLFTFCAPNRRRLRTLATFSATLSVMAIAGAIFMLTLYRRTDWGEYEKSKQTKDVGQVGSVVSALLLIIFTTSVFKLSTYPNTKVCYSIYACFTT